VGQRTLLLLLSGSSLVSSTTSSGSTTGGGGSTATGTDVHEKVLDILALESLYTIIPSENRSPGNERARVAGIIGGSYLGEDGSPDGLNILDLSGLDEGLELVGLYCRDEELAITNTQIRLNRGAVEGVINVR